MRVREIWRPIPGFNAFYSVSNLGRVRSEDRAINHGRGTINRYKGRLLKFGKNVGGYMKVNLCVGSRRYVRPVHRLVLEAFVGLRPDGMEACHGNGVRTDNRLSNLRWDTRKGNYLDAIKHGTCALRSGRVSK